MTRVRLVLACLVPLLAACSVTDRLSPYRIDVRQGNLVTQEMVAVLKPGMTKDQVRFALGTPLVVDVFHADRWDYIYRFQPGRGELQSRRLTVFFDDGRLARLEGDVVAQGGEGAAAAAPPSRVIDIGVAQPAPAARGAAGAAAAAEGAAAPQY